VDEVDACLLNNGGTYSSSKAASNLETAGPLHDLLSRYLSPTFEEADALDADSDGTGLISASATDLAPERSGPYRTAPIGRPSLPRLPSPSTTIS